MSATALLTRLSDLADWVMCRLVFLTLSLLTLTITLQIIARVFFAALPWTEELSRYLLVFATFGGASLAYKRGNHIAVTLLVARARGRLRELWGALIQLLSLFFFGLAIRSSIQLITLQIYQVSPALGLPMRLVYLALPLGFATMALHALAELVACVGRALGGEAA